MDGTDPPLNIQEGSSWAGVSLSVSDPFQSNANRMITALCTVDMDGMTYTRGSSGDYNRYARVIRDSGWSWDNLPSIVLPQGDFTYYFSLTAHAPVSFNPYRMKDSLIPLFMAFTG